MPSPSALSIEARRAAWDRLWQRLLSEPPRESESDELPDDPEEADEEAA